MNKNVIPFPVTNKKSAAVITKVGASISNLASGLMFNLHINSDMSLVSVLGNGNECSNHEAIITWLLAHYSREEIGSMNRPLESLTKALHNHLNDRLNNMEEPSC